MRRKLLVALASVSLLFGGVSAAGPAFAGPSVSPSVSAKTPPATAKHNAHKGMVLPKRNPNPKDSGGVHTNVFTSCAVTTCYRYATAEQSHASASGTSIETLVQKPAITTVGGADDHSLFELAEFNQAQDNLVELGWTVDPALNGDSDPHMFTFMWDSGNPTCYNGCVAHPYLDAVGCSPWCAGDNLASFIGTNHKWEIQHYSSGTAGWWVSVDNVFRGVWPDTSFGTPTSTSDYTQAFGELALEHTPSETDMGNGVLASTTTGVGVLARNFQLYNSTATPNLTAIGAGAQVEPTRWNIAMLSSSSFNWGGPGGNEDIQGCSGVGAQPSFGFGVAPYNGGYGTNCAFSNTSAGVPVTPVHNIGGEVTRNVCIPNLGTADGQTTTPIRVLVNTTYVKWRWFRDAACAGASLTYDYGQLNLPTTGGGWTALAHASLMRTSTLNSH